MYWHGSQNKTKRRLNILSFIDEVNTTYRPTSQISQTQLMLNIFRRPRSSVGLCIIHVYYFNIWTRGTCANLQMYTLHASYDVGGYVVLCQYSDRCPTCGRRKEDWLRKITCHYVSQSEDIRFSFWPCVSLLSPSLSPSLSVCLSVSLSPSLSLSLSLSLCLSVSVCLSLSPLFLLSILGVHNFRTFIWISTSYGTARGRQMISATEYGWYYMYLAWCYISWPMLRHDACYVSWRMLRLMTNGTSRDECYVTWRMLRLVTKVASQSCVSWRILHFMTNVS